MRLGVRGGPGEPDVIGQGPPQARIDSSRPGEHAPLDGRVDPTAVALLVAPECVADKRIRGQHAGLAVAAHVSVDFTAKFVHLAHALADDGAG